MGIPPRQVAETPEEVLEEIQEQLGYNPNLIKQIRETYKGDIDPGTEAELAEGTVYPLWREFLKAYAKLVGQTEDHPDQRVSQTFEDFGDLQGNFQDWWRDEGRELFIETGEIPIITVEGIDEDWQGDEDYPKHITLRIPLTVPRDNILKQFNNLLDQCHMGNLLYRHRHSTAEYALYPRSMYRADHLFRMLKVWILARQHRDVPDGDQPMPWWEVGHLAELAVGVDPYNDTPARTMQESRRHLAKLASDLYDKAEAIVHNAIRGIFPKDQIDEHAGPVDGDQPVLPNEPVAAIMPERSRSALPPVKQLELVNANPASITSIAAPTPEAQLTALASRIDLYWKIDEPCAEATLTYLTKRPDDIRRFGHISDDLKAKVLIKKPDHLYRWLKKGYLKSAVEPEGFHDAIVRDLLTKLAKRRAIHLVQKIINKMRAIGYAWPEFAVMENSIRSELERAQR